MSLGVQGSEYALAHPVFDIPLALLVLKKLYRNQLEQKKSH